MENNRRTIVIPYDFGPRSDYALQHGIQYAKMLDNDITLLHILPDLKREAEVVNKLKTIAEDTFKVYGIKPFVLVKTGKIRKAIKLVAQEMNATLVIMKTDGPRGMQRYLGSHAVRVMYGSKIPFIVVQNPPMRYNLKKVIVPIDFRSENKEKLKWINFLSRFYKSEIYLFYPNRTDYRIKNNLTFATRFLDGRNINYEIVHAKGKKEFPMETIEFSKLIRADMIVIMLSRYITIDKVLLGLRDQKYISNEYKIPIMCLNPNTDLHKLGGFN